MRELGIGILGCGNISSVYIDNLHRVYGLSVKGVADARPDAAKEKADKFGVSAMTVDDFLTSPDIDIVVNLTIPAVHADLTKSALEAGKHVFSEKPLATDVAMGGEIVDLAAGKGLLLGCAPDTFLGAGGRLSRRLIDDGAIGKVLFGTCFVLSHGMEHWHPDPEFFFKPGAGPVLDIGPYYIAALTNLLGPVTRVRSVTSTGFPERVVTAPGPKTGATITVETPTTALAILEFSSGAQIFLGASWDVWKHGHRPIELYGTDGSMLVPDPNFFGGTVEISEKGGEWQSIGSADMPLGVPNWPEAEPVQANYRGLGVAEMAMAIMSGTTQRASGAFAQHALEVMTAIVETPSDAAPASISGGLDRPPVLSDEEAARLMVGYGQPT